STWRSWAATSTICTAKSPRVGSGHGPGPARPGIRMAHGVAPPLAVALDALDQLRLHAGPGRQRPSGVQRASGAVLGRGVAFRAPAVRPGRLSRLGDHSRLPVARHGPALALLLRLAVGDQRRVLPGLV